VRQLKIVLDVGQRAGIQVSVCGEMASDPLAVVLLLGLGYRTLSVAPPALPFLKWVVRTIPVTVAARAAYAALDADRPSEITRTLREAMQEHFDPRMLDALSALPRQTGAATLRG
jgi:signal transduction protein with GAF and PtsI domain